MNRKWFGTDGVRGVANRQPMTAEDALQLGRAIGYRLKQMQPGRRPKVLIGKDTRLSGYMLETALESGLCSVGAETHLLGPLPTPGIAFLVSNMRADAGVVISASHNPFEDNGIKLFASDGFKLPDKDEAAIEQLLGSDELFAYRPTGVEIGRAYRISDAVGRYSVFAKSAFPRDLTLEGLKVVVDCANGASYHVAPQALHELGAEVVPLSVEPDGININRGCGALHPELMAQVVRETGAQVGIALDGDADRCILADEQGQVVNGDAIMAMLAMWMHREGRLSKDTLVATVMSNIGLERALQGEGLKMVRVGVGDRYVVERMRQDGFNLGGEQSGHVVALDYSTTGDGLITALLVLGLMVRTGRPLSELASCMRFYPQTLENLRVRQRTPLGELDELQHAIAGIEQKLGKEGRVLVRYSGTELLVRVMVEGPSEDITRSYAGELVDVLRALIG